MVLWGFVIAGELVIFFFRYCGFMGSGVICVGIGWDDNEEGDYNLMVKMKRDFKDFVDFLFIYSIGFQYNIF